MESSPAGKRLSGAPNPASNNTFTPSVSTQNVLIDEGIPASSSKLLTRLSEAAANNEAGISLSSALSRNQVTLIPSTCRFCTVTAARTESFSIPSFPCVFVFPTQPHDIAIQPASNIQFHLPFVFIHYLLFGYTLHKLKEKSLVFHHIGTHICRFLPKFAERN